MTTHRLIRSTCADVLAEATRLGAHDQPARSVGRAVSPWRYRHAQAPGRVAWGYKALPGGSVVSWCLEIEPGANGVLAHLSATPAAGPLTELPPRLLRLTMQAWARRELGLFARSVER